MPAVPKLLTCLVASIILGQAAAQSATFYVSPAGNDHWSGKLSKPNSAHTDGPVQSLNGARNVVNRLLWTPQAKSTKHVVIEDGVYNQTEPYTFDTNDSGTPSAPVIYEAAPGAHPIFSGGRRISGWKPGPKGVWTAQVPQVAAGKWYFEQLWINGRRATRARTPNVGLFYGVDHAKVDPGHGDPATLDRRAFRARPNDLAPIANLSGTELSDVNLIAFHSWESSRNRISAIDPQSGTIAVTSPVVWSFFEWGHPRYYLENYKGALDSPGEWFLDRNGNLSYIPLPGENMRTAVAIAPDCPTFIQIVADNVLGDPTGKRWVHDIVFKGLAFEYSQYLLPPTGHADGQAEISIPAVIEADGARNVTFDHCEIAHTGIYGISFRTGCRYDRVTHCYLHDLGAGGVQIGEGVIRSNPEERTDHITVDNNIIHGGDRIHHGSIGIWIAQSSDNQITHNDIGDLYYTGISAGWTWGYAASLSRNNNISFNRIHDIGQGVLNDMGGIYTLGISDGTVLRGNVIHDVHTYSGLGWGLYNDEGSSNILLENNLVYSTRSGSYHQHYGQDNLVRNNIFAFGEDAQAQRTRVEDRHALSFQHNIVLWNGGPMFNGDWQKNITVDHNLYWDKTIDTTPFANKTFAQWQAAGQDTGSLFADPLFANPAAHNFSLRPGSPAAKIGFVPFDTSQAGVTGDAAWKQLANAPMPVYNGPPEIPAFPITVVEDYEDIAVGGRPVGPNYNVENKGDSISVTDEAAASGTHSLKFEDAPGLAASFDPHMYYSPDHREGTTHCSFDLRMEAGANFYHEWRDSASPYLVGPSLSVAGGKLFVNNQALVEIPESTWVHIDVSAKLGKTSNGTWNLLVTVPGGPPAQFYGLKSGSANWKRLNWLGFVSNATEKTTFYIDNLKITPSAH